MKILKWIKSRLRKLVPLKIGVIFYRDILRGYRVYKGLLQEFGSETDIFSHYYPGTGDIYIASGLLKRRLLQSNTHSNYVLVVGGQAARHVAELFELNPIKVIPVPEVERLTAFRYYSSPCRTQVINLHYWSLRDRIDISFHMIGYKGSTFFEQYLLYSFADVKARDFVPPKFKDDGPAVDRLFAEHRLIPGRTVVLSPYANTSWKRFVRETVWVELAQGLKDVGYTVCTNSAGASETAIPGTVAVRIPFSDLKCFLERAGSFVGVRSGLCEVISSVACKKVIIYPSKYYWPDDREMDVATARDIFTLFSLPGYMDVTELEYDRSGSEQTLIASVMEIICGNSLS